MVNQNAAHHGGGDCEEVRTALPIDLLHTRQAEICLVHQRGGLQRMIHGLSAKIVRGSSTQFSINEGDQPIFGILIPGVDLDEQLGNLARA
jgi:hypothetical protein